jgi:two-component system nitrogen regulation response regulator GlnG
MSMLFNAGFATALVAASGLAWAAIAADSAASKANGVPPPGLYHRILREIEVPLLTAALAATRGNQIRAADLLGLNRNTLRKKIRDLGIKVIRTPGM